MKRLDTILDSERSEKRDGFTIIWFFLCVRTLFQDESVNLEFSGIGVFDGKCILVNTFRCYFLIFYIVFKITFYKGTQIFVMY